jgi:hypothetical protein
MTEKRSSYLDRKIRLALDFTEDRKINLDTADQIFGDVRVMFDDCRDRRGFGEKAFLERSKSILVVLGRLKCVLKGKPLSDLEWLMDYLLTEVTKKAEKTEPS